MSSKKSSNDSKKDLKETKEIKITNDENSGSTSKISKSKDKELKNKSSNDDLEKKEEAIQVASSEVKKPKKKDSQYKTNDINKEENISMKDIEEDSSSSKKTNKNAKKVESEDTSDDKESKSKKSDRKSRSPTGYNMFMKEKMPEVEAENQKEKLKIIGGLWKELNDTEKEKYNTEALSHKKVIDDKDFTEKNKKKGKNISGYTLFMQESIKNIEAESQRDKMVKVAKLWKDASSEVKDEYNEKAKTIKNDYKSQNEEVEIN